MPVLARHGALYAEERGWGRAFELLVAEIVTEFRRDTINDLVVRHLPPKAYATTASIDKDYIPARWDAINFSEKHVGIIATEPVSSQKTLANGSTETTYAFTVQDRNADWGEAVASTPLTFVILQTRDGKKTLSSSFKRDYVATGYYR